MFHGNVNSLHKALMLFTAMMLTPVFGEAQLSEEPQQLPQQISLKSQSADDSAADGGKPLTGMSHGDVNSLIQGMYHHGNVNLLVDNPHRISTLCVFVAVVGYLTAMFQGRGNHTGTYNSEGNTTEGPSWDPAGQVPFRTWINEVHAWLNVTSSRLTLSAQATAIQRGLRGNARRLAMATPPAAIAMGAAINGVNTDPVTYLLHQIANRYSELEDERTMTMGRAIVDFRRRPDERIDDLLARFDLARADAASVGADLNNVFLHTTYLLQIVGVSTQEVVQIAAASQCIHAPAPAAVRCLGHEAQADGAHCIEAPR